MLYCKDLNRSINYADPHVTPALIMLFIPNATVDHPVATFSFKSLIIGVWCKQDVLDQRPPQNTAHTDYLVSLDSSLNVAPCATKFKTCTQQTQTSCFDSLMATAVAPHRS